MGDWADDEIDADITYGDWSEDADECDHLEYEIDILTGRATCDHCEHHWYMSSEEMAREEKRQAEAYDAFHRQAEQSE